MKAKHEVPTTGTPVFKETRYGSSESGEDPVVPNNISTVRCGRRLYRPFTAPRSAFSPAYRLWKHGICKPMTIITPLDRSKIKHEYTTPRYSRFRTWHPDYQHHCLDVVVVHNPEARPYPIFMKRGYSGVQWDKARPGEYDNVWVVRDLSGDAHWDA